MILSTFTAKLVFFTNCGQSNIVKFNYLSNRNRTTRPHRGLASPPFAIFDPRSPPGGRITLIPHILFRRSKEIRSSSALSRSSGRGGGRGQIFVVFLIFYRKIFGCWGWNSEFNRVWIRAASWTHSARVIGTGGRDGGRGNHDATPLWGGAWRNGRDKFIVLVVHWCMIAVIGSGCHMMNWRTVFLKKKY